MTSEQGKQTHRLVENSSLHSISGGFSMLCFISTGHCIFSSHHPWVTCTHFKVGKYPYILRSNKQQSRASKIQASTTLPSKSKAIPFLDRPPALDGSMVGDVGFDPFNISSFLDIRWLRESEIKHCRIAMLAVVGWFVQEVYHLPHEIYSATVPTDAFWKTLATGPMGQILLWTSLFEIMSTPAVIQMLQGSGREPGYFGFDPLGLGKNPSVYKRFQLSELKNGRLAMIAMGGLIHQAFLTHMGAIQQLQQHKFFP